MRRILLVLAVALPLLAQKPEAEEAYARGLALLHNFEYEDAEKAFQEAQQLEPNFAMAYWGEAMAQTHPIWFQQDRDKARAILNRLGATPAERLAKARNERERDYLRALDVLYGEGEKEARDFLYADAMAALHAKDPDDADAAAFHALAILGTAHAGRDFATYMRAAAILEEVFPANKRHPGVLHYLIHSYDDPQHAPLGMRAARLYGEVAPNAPHALHMTSHIFIAMGMWDDVVSANRRAIDVTNQQRAARGRPSADCGHYPTWLHYGLLQKGRFDDARKALDACRASAFVENFAAGSPFDSQRGRLLEYAEMRAQLAASGLPLTKSDASALPAGITTAPKVQFMMAYGDALDAARRADAAALKSAAEQMRTLQSQAGSSRGSASNPSDRIRAEVMVQEVEALELIAAGKRDAAIAILEQAAKAERAMPIEFGPPIVPKPAAELLGDQLLAAGRTEDAAAAYRTALERTPGRTRAMEALAQAGKTASAAKTTATPHVH
ncbi:MAG TPA: tetratricopeptide repeat protein [Thermoanaerobaculia bacterium]|nr:tetratricopeptide repeat protein [Thermoanaerobaculia bacterium]